MDYEDPSRIIHQFEFIDEVKEEDYSEENMPEAKKLLFKKRLKEINAGLTKT